VTADRAVMLPSQPDSAGCLLIIGGYDDISTALRSVTAEAVSRINVSPELGDFFEVRFVGLGQRPGWNAGIGEAVTRLAAELTRPTGPAATYYFALLTADRSAWLVKELLDACADHPVISRLPIRYRGLASVDDRSPGPEQPDLRNAAETSRPSDILIVSAGTGQRAALAYQVQRFASELLPDFASGTQAGLTAAHLGQLQPGAKGETAELPPYQHDELSPVPKEPVTWPRLPVPSRVPDVVARPSRELALPPPSSLRLVLPALRQDAGRISERWLPGRHRGRRAARESHDEGQAARQSTLIFLALVGDEGMGDRAAWRRGQSVLLEIDVKLAAARRYRVQALRSAGDAGMTEPREAGRLTRRDIGRPAGILDFTRVLNIVRTGVKREVIAAAAAARRPAIVFFAADAPFADAITTGIYSALTSEATVTWIVPEQLSAMLSPRFEEGGARQLTDHSAIADEVCSQLSADNSHDEDE